MMTVLFNLNPNLVFSELAPPLPPGLCRRRVLLLDDARHGTAVKVDFRLTLRWKRLVSTP